MTVRTSSVICLLPEPIEAGRPCSGIPPWTMHARWKSQRSSMRLRRTDTQASHASNLYEECVFLWTARDRSTRAPNIRLTNLVRLDERLAAYCESTAVARHRQPQPVLA